jgi:hypothetical protein
MTAEQSVLERMRLLPPDRHRSPIGLCADLGVRITAAEIDKARAEMWSGFPREMTS